MAEEFDNFSWKFEMPELNAYHEKHRTSKLDNIYI
jgi:hypothetical protein